MKWSAKNDDALIKAHLREIKGAHRETLKGTKAGSEILAADADRRASIAARALELWPESRADSVSHVASELLRANGRDWSAARLARAVDAAAIINREHPAFAGFNWFPFKPLISAVEKAVEREPLSAELHAALEKWKAALSPRQLTPAEERQLGEAGTVALEENSARPWSQISEAFETMERLNRIRSPLTEERKLIERLSSLLSRDGDKPRKVPGLVQIDGSDAVGALVASDLPKAAAEWHCVGSRAEPCAFTQLNRSFQEMVGCRRWSCGQNKTR